MKYMLVPLVAAAGLSLAAGSAAFAFGQSHGQGQHQFGRGGDFLNADFADFDLDGNGLITIEDLKAQADARFAAADSDGDGKLGQDELVAAAQARMAERMAANTAGHGGMGPGQHQGRMGAQGPDMEKRLRWMTETMLDRRDADGDGMLGRAEMQDEETSLAGMERMIDRFDTDDDNAISAAEFDEAQKEAWLRGRHRDGDRRGRN